MRIISNHQLSIGDKKNLLENLEIENEDKIIDIFSNVETLAEELGEHGQHFFDCLRYLLKKKQLQIIPVKFNGIDLAHCKQMILYDGDNYISTDGSINFTLAALIKNSESFDVSVPWEGEIFKKRIESARSNFEKIFNKEHPAYTYISVSEVEGIINSVGRDKDIQDLLFDSISLSNHSIYNEKIKKIKESKKERFDKFRLDIQDSPKFPHPEGPRDYQLNAYQTWKQNKEQGIFAMATGTGKTVTALNILLEEFKLTHSYQSIIVVPTQALSIQWQKEALNFNFWEIINTISDLSWFDKINSIKKKILLGYRDNFIIITSYASFNNAKFQSFVKELNNKNEVIFIADEAHNLGSSRSSQNLPYNITKRIGLSATPERVYDDIGSSLIFEFFNSYPPCYTFNYSMRKAIENEILCRYIYNPIFVTLTDIETEEYKAISIKLMAYFDTKSSTFKSGAETLLRQRKQIIHKAYNKKLELNKILQKLNAERKHLKYTFIYAPEGFEPIYSDYEDYELEAEDERIINNYSTILNSFGYKTYQFLGETINREKVLQQFADGKIDILLSMKCLDEGVDIPRAEVAIFCSSTGNPRQFIQRRGRVLRYHKEKEIANIYDLVVVPFDKQDIENAETDFTIFERSLFINELTRVLNFLSLSENANIVLKEQFESICENLNIDLYKIYNNIIENQTICD